MLTGYPACLNRFVFSCFLNEIAESADCQDAGRALHSLEATTSKTRSLRVLKCLHEIDSKFSIFDLRERADESEVDQPHMQEPDCAKLCK